MKKLITHILTAFIFMLIFPVPHEKRAPIAVVVSGDFELKENMLREDLLEIYTLRRRTWPDNSRVKIADYKGETEIRKQFYGFLEVDIGSIKRIWLKEQFTGRSLPPTIVNSHEKMIEVVSRQAGTIGYIPLDLVPETLQILAVIE